MFLDKNYSLPKELMILDESGYLQKQHLTSAHEQSTLTHGIIYEKIFLFLLYTDIQFNISCL